MKKKFVKTGFEFTAALKAKEKLKGNILDAHGYGSDHRVCRKSYNHPISKIDWIGKKIFGR